MKQTAMKITALYCRTAQSSFEAIENQKQLLTAYTKEYGYSNAAFYIDNGASGITANRPALQAMLSDVHLHKIALVIVTDISRLGRDMFLFNHLAHEIHDEYGVAILTVKTGEVPVIPSLEALMALINSLVMENGGAAE